MPLKLCLAGDIYSGLVRGLQECTKLAIKLMMVMVIPLPLERPPMGLIPNVIPMGTTVANTFPYAHFIFLQKISSPYHTAKLGIPPSHLKEAIPQKIPRGIIFMSAWCTQQLPPSQDNTWHRTSQPSVIGAIVSKMEAILSWRP